tara:strand:+ start:79 stop:360 length:282 start_codon:yes stop_codon:yes gene_type:complete
LKRYFLNIKIKAKNSTLPIIIKIIKRDFDITLILLKSKYSILYKLEFTVFIIVNIPNLNDCINEMPVIDNKDAMVVSEIINTRIDKKYLLITS